VLEAEAAEAEGAQGEEEQMPMASGDGTGKEDNAQVHRTAVGLLRATLLAGSPLTQARRVGAGRGDTDGADQMLAGGGSEAGSSERSSGFSSAQSSVAFVVRRSGIEARVHPSSAVAAGVEAALEQLKRAEALARRGGAD